MHKAIRSRTKSTEITPEFIRPTHVTRYVGNFTKFLRPCDTEPCNKVRHVYAMKIQYGGNKCPVYTSVKFEGACIDSGADQYVVGKNQAISYGRSTGRIIETTDRPLTFKIGDG